VSSRRWLELAIPVLAGAVYVLTACPYVLGGDCGEFATLIETGGVAHPPGFPLYVLLLRLFHFVPAQNPAHGAALLSAVTATGTVYALIRAARLYGASAAASAIAAGIYAAATITWKLAVHAEVFSQAALLAAVVLVVSAPAFPLTGARRGLALGLVAGLGISTHLAVVFMAPAGLYAFVRAFRAAERRGLVVAAAVAGLVVGLLPYAFIVVSARTADAGSAWIWGNPVDLPRLFEHFRRADYGSLQLSAAGTPRDPAAHLARFFVVAVTEFLGLPLIALLGGMVALARSRRTRAALRAHGDLFALIGTFCTMGLCFVGLFNQPLVVVGPSIVERFYVLPMLPAVVLAALSLDVLVPSILERALGVFLPFFATLAGFALSMEPVREYTRPTLQYYVDNVLAYVPPGTVILGNGDHVIGGFLYGLLAQRQRADVGFIAVDLLNADWYRARTSRKLGVALSPPAGAERVERWIEQLQAAGKVVMLSGRIVRGLESRFPSYPEGPLVRVLPKGSFAPPPGAVEARNLALYSAFRLEAAPPASRDTWSGVVQSQYAEPWQVLSGAFKAIGDDAAAARCRERAVELAPWLGTAR